MVEFVHSYICIFSQQISVDSVVIIIVYLQKYRYQFCLLFRHSHREGVQHMYASLIVSQKKMFTLESFPNSTMTSLHSFSRVYSCNLVIINNIVLLVKNNNSNLLYIILMNSLLCLFEGVKLKHALVRIRACWFVVQSITKEPLTTK